MVARRDEREQSIKGEGKGKEEAQVKRLLVRLLRRRQLRVAGHERRSDGRDGRGRRGRDGLVRGRDVGGVGGGGGGGVDEVDGARLRVGFGDGGEFLDLRETSR